MYDIDDFLEKLPYGNKDCNCRLVYVYFGIIILLIIIYMIIMVNFFGASRLNNVDFMNVLLIKIPGIGDIAGWPISHFITFFIAGLLFPNCFVLVFILGVLWEVVESVVGDLVKLFKGSPEKVEGTMYKESWISGRVEDIIFDVLGFLAGKMIIDAYRDSKYGNHKIHPY